MILPPVQDKVRELCGDGTISIQEVVERLSVMREKPIKLFEEEWSLGPLTAFKFEHENDIMIFFPRQKSMQYKHHCIYHELGHIYLESLYIPLAPSYFSEEMLKAAEGAINMSCRAVPNHPVERWAEDFAFEMSKRTRVGSSDPDPFFC
jgi:hypothetical protein